MSDSGRRRRIETDSITNMLHRSMPSKASGLVHMFARLRPLFEVDQDEPRILFQANSTDNVVTVGLKCTQRMQAHAMAAGVIFAAFREPRFKQLSAEERGALFAPAGDLLSWAVASELQQSPRQADGFERSLEDILPGARPEIDETLLRGLSEPQRRLGMLIFQMSLAFILLHELGHLDLGHAGQIGSASLEQEKDADRFAAEWLLSWPNEADPNDGGRISEFVAIAVALLWITTLNIFLGAHGGETHPEGYDRLFQVLDQTINRENDLEYNGVWGFVCEMLLLHMEAAGFKFGPASYPRDGDLRDEANYLIDRIANRGLT